MFPKNLPTLLRSIAATLAVLSPLSLAQTPSPLIPVQCGHSSDSPLPARPARHARESTLATAEAIDKAGRTTQGFLSTEEPTNLSFDRYRIVEYADCVVSTSCYWTDLAAQLARAQSVLEGLISTRKSGEKLAIVLDIDETSLSSYCEEKREDFGYIASMYNAWVVTPEASIPIPGTLALFNQARAADVSVFFITGRPGVKGAADDQTEATARNLSAAGYKDWQGLTLRDESERNTDTALYKSSARSRIVDAGYRILMNVGDQWSDLNGTPRAEVSVKLPNPFYYLP